MSREPLLTPQAHPEAPPVATAEQHGLVARAARNADVQLAGELAGFLAELLALFAHTVRPAPPAADEPRAS